ISGPRGRRFKSSRPDSTYEEQGTNAGTKWKEAPPAATGRARAAIPRGTTCGSNPVRGCHADGLVPHVEEGLVRHHPRRRTTATDPTRPRERTSEKHRFGIEGEGVECCVG